MVVMIMRLVIMIMVVVMVMPFMIMIFVGMICDDHGLGIAVMLAGVRCSSSCEAPSDRCLALDGCADCGIVRSRRPRSGRARHGCGGAELR